MMEKLKLTFDNQVSRQSLFYRIVANPVSERWARKIKHLSSIAHSPLETTGRSTAGDVQSTHREFCHFAGIDYEDTDYDDQPSLNRLHEQYVHNHDRLSLLANNDILYKFHNAIHDMEKKSQGNRFYVGWGVKEGPLGEKFNCNEHYAETLVKNNLYLPWTELGKTPLDYFNNSEPNDLASLCALAKPHITLRAKFMIARRDFAPPPLPQEFHEWFLQYRATWLAHHGITDWRPRDEYVGVLLAEPQDTTIDIEQVLKEYPTFHSLEIV
jgi:hypothetical protein